MLFRSNDTATTEIYTTQYTLSLHDALPSFDSTVILPRPAACADDTASDSAAANIAKAIDLPTFFPTLSSKLAGTNHLNIMVLLLQVEHFS